MSKTFALDAPIKRGNFEKIAVSLGDRPWHGYSEEAMWVKKVGDGLYQLQNTPFFAKGLAYLDIVSARLESGRLVFLDVQEASRRSTYRIHVKNATLQPPVQHALQELRALGCTFESYEQPLWTLYALDVPASTVDLAYKVLDIGEKNSLWEFDEGLFGGRDH